MCITFLYWWSTFNETRSIPRKCFKNLSMSKQSPTLTGPRWKLQANWAQKVSKQITRTNIVIEQHPVWQPKTLTNFCSRHWFLFNSLTPMKSHDCPLFNELRWWVITLPIFVCCQHLIARKFAELVGFNRGIQLFNSACCFDELSRVSILCISNASFETAVSQCQNLISWANIYDHGVRQGNMGQILSQWQRPVASSVAMDLLHWAMRTSLHRFIVITIEMASKGGELFAVVDLL